MTTDNVKLLEVKILTLGYSNPQMAAGYGSRYENVIVGIGDGSTVFDDDFEFDSRVYYYFADEAEYRAAAFGTEETDLPFIIIKEID